jgi:hypothetical protein
VLRCDIWDVGRKASASLKELHDVKGCSYHADILTQNKHFRDRDVCISQSMHNAVLSFNLMRTLIEGCAWRFLAEHIFEAIAVRDLVRWIGEAKAELYLF